MYRLLLLGVCVIWTSNAVKLRTFNGVDKNARNEDSVPRGSFAELQQYYHGDDQISNSQDLHTIELFRSLNPTISIISPSSSEGKPSASIETVANNVKIQQNPSGQRFSNQEIQTPKSIIQEGESEKDSKNQKKLIPEIVQNNGNQPQESLSSVGVEGAPKTENRRKLSNSRRKSSKKETQDEKISYHEEPEEIPTKPFYPGKGQWARKGTRHHPHVTKHYNNLSSKDAEQTPGSKVFHQNKKIFEEEKEILNQHLQKHEDHPEHSSHGLAPAKFVPYRTYAQVRKSHTKKHKPRKNKNKRIKESIKDSKVHTMYTEEGYEDNAYDHGEQKKKANRHELERNIEADAKILKKNIEVYESPQHHEDSEEQRKSDEHIDDNQEKVEDVAKNENHHPLQHNSKDNKTRYQENSSRRETNNNQKKRQSPKSSEYANNFDLTIDEKKYGASPPIPSHPKKENDGSENESKSSAIDSELKDRNNQPEDKRSNRKQSLNSRKKKKKEKIYFGDEDWFQKYRFKNIGKYFKNFDPTEDKEEEEEEVREEVEEKPKEERREEAKFEMIKEAKDQEPVNIKEETKGDIKEETKDNVKHRNQDEEIDLPIQSYKDKEEHQKHQKETIIQEDTKALSVNQQKHGDDNTSQMGHEIKVFLNFPPIKTSLEEEKMIDTVMGETKFGVKITSPNVALYRRTRRSSENSDEKYPYYNSKDLDTTSSLRYAENLESIPEKKKYSMAFYDNADKIECPETTNVDPVPKRITKVQGGKEMNDTKLENDTEVNKSRLNGKLGDQIDCLKTRYFGENPLDNPLFHEKNVDVPSSIFNNEEYDYEDYENEADKEENESGRKSKSVQLDDQNKNTSSLTIEENLPQAEALRRRITKKRRIRPYPSYYNSIYQRYPQRHHILIPQNKPLQQFSHNSYSHPMNDPYSLTPVQHSLTPIQQPQREPTYSQTHPPMVTINEPLKQFSEVHYKEEIKPSEQLNVFADIINNIKSSNEDSDSQESSVEEIAIIRRPSRNKNRYKADIGKYSYHTSTTSKPFLPTPVQDKEDRRYKKKIPVDILPEHKDAAEIIIVKTRPKHQRGKPYVHDDSSKPGVKTNHRDKDEPNLEEKDSTYFQKENFPNPTNHRKVEQNFVGTPSDQENTYDNLEITTNNHYFVGMRPPPEFPYKHPNFYNPPMKKKRRVSYPKRRRRVKRNAARGYAEIRRNNQNEGQPEQKEEQDDYEPHRPKTFHYDEKTGKIIYDKKAEPEIAEYDYVEVEEPTHPPPKKKEETKRFNPTPPPGPSYLDFIKVLKTDPNYKIIDDPKPVKKKETKEEEKENNHGIHTTPKTSTGVPEFLQVLAKVKTDKNYKIYLEPTPQPKKKTTTERFEEVEDSDEEQSEVQNSPGVQGILGLQSPFQVFDISEFVPKTKDYSPRTSIDTSKYTSIRRNPVKQNEEQQNQESNAERLENSKEGILQRQEKVEQEQIIRSATKQQSNRRMQEEILTTTQQSHTIDSPTTPIKSTTPYDDTSKERRVLRGRRRSTTPKPSTTETSVRPTFRRQRGKTRFRSTTQPPELVNGDSIRNRRYLQKGNYEVPKNHRKEYAETRNDISKVLRVTPTPRTITLSIIDQMRLTSSVNRNSAKNDELETVPLDGKSVENKSSESKQDDVEVFKDYDKDKKHGGNYKYKKVQIRITSNYKPGESRDKEESTLNKEGNVDGKDVNDDEKRLVDVVPKADSFYSDPKLPEHVNTLNEKKYVITETFFEEQNDGNEEFFDENTTLRLESTTKKVPAFIKDPSKRLYFYAPL